MKTEYFLKCIEQTFIDCLQLVKRKNKDYANLGDPFKNFNMTTQVGVTPARGILVRVSDKISRISNLLDRPPAVTDESLIDTIRDAINYLAILEALLVSYREEKSVACERDYEIAEDVRETDEEERKFYNRQTR